jgi:CheY-like chemotaxis protein
MMKPHREQIQILLVEDDDGHARLIERNLRKVSLINPIDRVVDGQEAIDYLRNQGRYADMRTYPRPKLILLDINLPRLDGIEVLERIKSDSDLCALPVIMLTSTDTQSEIDRCYRAGANGYVAKPVNISTLGEKLNRLGMFLEIVELPEVA